MEKILRIVVLLTVAANSIFAAAQSPDTAKRWRWIAEPQFDYAFPFVGQLAAVRVDSLWGFIDTTGKFVIEPRFDDIGNMFVPYKFIKRSGWRQFIESEMRTAYFADGYAFTKVKSKYLTPVEKDNKIGFIDTNGRIVHEPRFIMAENFGNCDLILVWDASDSIKIGLLDAKGNFLIEPMFDQITAIDSSFSSMTLNGKYGLISAAGKIIAQPIYDDVIPYDDSQVLARRGDSLVAIDQKGGVSNFASPNNLPKRVSIIACAGRYGLAGADGKVLVEPCYSKIWTLANGVFITLRGGLFGVVDPSGVVLSEPIYTEILDTYRYDCLFVTKKSKVGVIHPLKKLVFAPVFDHSVCLVGDTVAMGQIGDEIYSLNLKGELTFLHKVRDDSDAYFSIPDEIDCGDQYIISQNRIMDKDGKLLFEHPTQDDYHVRYCGNDRFLVIRRVSVEGVIDGEAYFMMRETYGYLEIIK